MRIPVWLVIITALLAFGVVFVVGQAIIQPNLPLILSAGFDLEKITPNADNNDDITPFRYELSRGAHISVLLENNDPDSVANGMTFAFRQDQYRMAGDYTVLFSGVVDGYTLPDEDVAGIIERRLIPDGTYTWRFIAEDAASGTREETTGTLVVEDADSPLPRITTFTVGPDTFTPNQDGVNDRVSINVYLEKEAELRVFLIAETLDTENADEMREIPISARVEGRQPGEAGRHLFDYEGGIDLGADPPPDGTYTIAATAQDAEGQRIRRETTLTILAGGKPRAEIAAQPVGVDVIFEGRAWDERYRSDFDVLGELVEPPAAEGENLTFSEITLPVGDLLVFMLTVENYSDVPIRTTYPPPGTVYEQGQAAASIGAFESPGAWRVGLQCETSTESLPFPYRWAIGSADVLDAVPNPDNPDELFYYLPPQTRSVVWGAVRLTELEERANPQTCWAGLIHEKVAISLRNAYVGPRPVRLVETP